MTTRQEKYPDTDTFTFYNANPKNRLTGDCTFRAISTAMNQDYNKTVMDMASMMCETGYVINGSKLEEKYMLSKGWVKHHQPKHPDGKKYTGRQFCKEYSKGTYVAHIGGHHIVCIKDGKVLDTWDSTRKCVGIYWTKE